MSQRLIAISVGNTRTRVGCFEGEELNNVQGHLSGSGEAEVASICKQVEELVADTHDKTPIVISSVNAKVSAAIAMEIDSRGLGQVMRIQKEVAVPMQHTLDDASTVGQDRLLCAYAAFKRAKQACIVIDAGTAITVDFVDGEGVFHGGAIAPGLTMMLKAMHEHTAALPSLEYAAPDPARGPLGKDTSHAMILGVRNAAVGLVYRSIDLYAAFYEAYPQVLATGGDAAVLFGEDELVEHVVQDLQLVGILECWKAMNEDEYGEDEGDEGV